MGKYNDLAILKRVKARTQHACCSCDKAIARGEFYYREHIEDKFLHSLHSKAFCSSCRQEVTRSIEG